MKKKAVPLDEMLKDLTPERREKIRQRAEQLAKEHEANRIGKAGPDEVQERSETPNE